MHQGIKVKVGRLNTVLVLHHLITYPKIEAAHLQIGFLRLRVHQLSDRLVELVNGGRAGGTERVRFRNTLKCLYRRCTKNNYMVIVPQYIVVVKKQYRSYREFEKIFLRMLNLRCLISFYLV